MTDIILKKDNFKRNCIIFAISSVIFISFGTSYFLSNRGCREYAQNLKKCTPFECTQRVVGFQSKYVGHTALNISRKITGTEKDPFFNKSTCNVIEINNVEKNEKVSCKYSDKMHRIAVERAEILFGNKLPPIPEGKNLSKMEISALRATYANRTTEQEKECQGN